MRRATWAARPDRQCKRFLSTLSLRRATLWVLTGGSSCNDFYPRSPCGERPDTSIIILDEYQFLSTLSLRRATDDLQVPASVSKISIHALLAESDRLIPSLSTMLFDFYPRSPCGERLYANFSGFYWWIISIHALLAESDGCQRPCERPTTNFYPRSPCGERHIRANFCLLVYYFYPRSPCGERPKAAAASACFATFLSTLSLRRATQTQGLKIPALCISIHALLAESDPKRFRDALKHLHFYPRSPCGERHSIMFVNLRVVDISIHALLAESDAKTFEHYYNQYDFYPRSPCGERRNSPVVVPRTGHFYPRSPCGERRRRSVKLFRQNYISIHALLAESDYITIITICIVLRFLSTLSLRRATSLLCYMIHLLSYFYPRSPCGERLLEQSASYNAALENFYPRSPCGERPYGALKHVHQTEISIHALLAESDHDDKY